MYAGHVFFCNSASQEQCLKRKLYTCADRKTLPTGKIKRESVILLYNVETKRLLGPFTTASESGRNLESGAWALDIDEHSASENVKVEWEELHQIENAPEKLPFLRNPRTCTLSETQT